MYHKNKIVEPIWLTWSDPVTAKKQFVFNYAELLHMKQCYISNHIIADKPMYSDKCNRKLNDWIIRLTWSDPGNSKKW